MWMLVWNNIARRATHTILGLLLLAFVTAGFFFSQQLLAGMKAGVEQGIGRLGADLVVLPQNMGSSGEFMLFSSEPMNIYMPADLWPRIQSAEGVMAATPQFFTQTLSEDCCSLGQAYRLVGFDRKTDFILRPWIEKNLQRDLKPTEILLGADIPAFVGDRAVILGQVFHVAGRLEPTGASLDNTVFVSIDVARQLAQTSPYLEGIFSGDHPASELVSAVLVRLRPGADPSAVGEELAKLPGIRIDFSANLAQEAKNHIFLSGRIMQVLTVGLWIICLVSVANHFINEVWKRKREVGVMRALGAGPGQVAFLFIAEAAALALGGGLAGLPGGYYLTRFTVTRLLQDLALPYYHPEAIQVLEQGALSLAAAVITGILAAVYPAFLAARLDPANAISRGELD